MVPLFPTTRFSWAPCAGHDGSVAVVAMGDTTLAWSITASAMALSTQRAVAWARPSSLANGASPFSTQRPRRVHNGRACSHLLLSSSFWVWCALFLLWRLLVWRCESGPMSFSRWQCGQGVENVLAECPDPSTWWLGRVTDGPRLGSSD